VVESVDQMRDDISLLYKFHMLFNLLAKSWSFFFLSPILVDLDLIVNNSAFLTLLRYVCDLNSVLFKYVLNKVTCISDAGAFNCVN
jgi:hypothetical protein